MSTSAVARNYASTLYDLAARDGSEARFGELISAIGSLYETDSGFHHFLNAPGIALAEKKAALRAALGGDTPEPFVRFLLVVLDRRRHNSLPGIALAYREILDEKAGRVRPVVTLPYEPDPELANAIVSALEKRFDKKMIPEFRVDPEIVGGLIVRAGDRLLDASVRRGLKDLKQELIEA
ncbi:MAG: ATP synthase F1 subunit delta [Gemmatimonadota bacterium]|nr:ATP synthase F1 subunit delta [Gemmatimonadota bacterium]